MRGGFLTTLELEDATWAIWLVIREPRNGAEELALLFRPTGRRTTLRLYRVVTAELGGLLLGGRRSVVLSRLESELRAAIAQARGWSSAHDDDSDALVRPSS